MALRLNADGVILAVAPGL